MIPSQTQTASQQPFYSTPFYSTDYNSMKTSIAPHFNSSPYMSPYSSHNRLTIHDRRQSMMGARVKTPSTPPPPSTEVRTRPDYSAQTHSILSEEVPITTNTSQPPIGSWDTTQPPTQPSAQPLQAVQPNLPPLSEALHGLSSSPSLAVSPPMQAQQAALSTMNNVVTSPPNNFYATNPYLEMQAPVNVYPHQDQFENDPSKMTHASVSDRMVPQDSTTAPPNSYERRVTYPFVSSLETGAGLVMSNMIPSEPAGSSPLNNNNATFAHGNLVAANSVPVQGMPRVSAAVDYVDSLGLQQQIPPSHHVTHSAAQAQTGIHPISWSQNGSDMNSMDGSVNGSKTYSFVPLSGVNSKKRPRRRFDEIERLYVCNWGDCEKAYGTLNHLNAHVNMQKHGPKRLPAEFKEMRKEWRKHKRAQEEAAKQAAAYHQQQSQAQQVQLQQQASLCDPVLAAHMHSVHHPLAMHAMSHHQPHQLPHPHAHPNQHHPHSQSQHHHPMGF
ncbi:hypothetical protein BX616_006452 [Lobosporangium transversale]|nr:hypothetical protein BX616_006452 [Lobosporangium transversale]